MISEDVIFEAIKKNIILILPELDSREIKKDDNLTELGANSLDRSEIVIKSMEDLQLQVPLVELGQVHNLRDLINVFLKKANSGT